MLHITANYFSFVKGKDKIKSFTKLLYNNKTATYLTATYCNFLY